MSFSIEELSGKVIKKAITRGKKELLVNAIQTDDGREILVRREGTSIVKDDVIDALNNKTVVAVGIVDGSIFVATEIKEKDDEQEDKTRVSHSDR